MQAVAWDGRFTRSRRGLSTFGYVGLAQFLPAILLFPISGHASDRFERRNVLWACLRRICGVLCPAACLAPARRPVRSVYLCGVGADWSGAVVQQTLPAARSCRSWLPRSTSRTRWHGTPASFQAATILGPSFGGIVYAAFKGPSVVYVVAMVTAIGATLSSFRIRPEVKARQKEPMSLKTVFAGLALHLAEETDSGGDFAGSVRCAAGRGGRLASGVRAGDSAYRTLGIGAAAHGSGSGSGDYGGNGWRTGRYVASPVRTLLWSVAGFGVFTIIFALSHNLVLSLIALFYGASDMISVIIRATLTQLATPDAMRGRVTAVDMIFIGTSNEFGQFESGVTAQWFGTVPAAVLGGIGTLVVIGLWAWLFRNCGRRGN